jgi:hypothetical protein
MIPNRDKEREILSKKADDEDYAIETGTVTFDNGEKIIKLKGIWKCTKEVINSKGQKYSEVQVGGIDEENTDGWCYNCGGERLHPLGSNTSNCSNCSNFVRYYCQKAIDTIKDQNLNPIMFPSHLNTLKDLNCNHLSDNIICYNKDKIVGKHDLKVAVIESLKRVYESKMWDDIERSAIKIWAKNFFNITDEEFK